MKAVLDFLDRLNMVDSEIYQGNPAANARAVGTGPFKVAEYVPGDHIYLLKNPNYWQSGQPHLDGINVTFYADLQALIIALESGAIDYAMNPAENDIVRLQSNPKFVHIQNKATGLWWATYVNTTRPPLDNKQVRQALQYALNRQRWIDTGLAGFGTPRSLPWSPSSLAYDAARSNTYTFDLDKAKSLIQQSGVSNISIDFNVNQAAYPQLVSLGPIFQADLASIGVTLNLKNVDPQAYALSTNVQNRTFGIGTQGNCCTAMKEAFILPLISTAYNPTINFPGFSDPTYTQVLDSVAVEPDQEKRVGLYKQFNDIMLDQAFAMGIAGRLQDHLMASNVHDVAYTMHEAIDFASAWMS